MPVKKSKPRTATSLRRITKYKETYRAKTVPLWFKKTMPEGAALLEDWLTNQDELEKQIFAQLDLDGVDGEQQLYYAAFARRLFVKCLNFYDATYAKEKLSLKTEFLLRGLDNAELETIIGICDTKCNLVRGIVVDLQDIEDKLDNASWGLAALKALIDAIEAKLDDPTSGLANLKALIDDLEDKLDNGTYGLAALKALIDALELKLDDGTFGLEALKDLLDAIEAKLDNGTYGLAALKALLDAIEGKLDNATYGLDALHDLLDAIEAKLDKRMHCMTFFSLTNYLIQLTAAPADVNLPSVVISGLPAGAILDKVLVFLIFRALENTYDFGTNAISGLQYIRIKKSTGAWGVDDLPCIALTNNMWTISADTREFGDIVGGDDSLDVKAEVDGNGTYNIRFEDGLVLFNSFRLWDVQVMIKVWYH